MAFSKRGETAVVSLMGEWIEPSGAPCAKTMFSGGELRGEFGALHLGGLGIRPDCRPRGSHSLLVGDRAHVLKDAIIVVKESHCEWDVNIILTYGWAERFLGKSTCLLDCD